MSLDCCPIHQCEPQSFCGFMKCPQCNWEQRPKPSLEEQIIALTDMYKSISIQCAANHDHKVRQIDENRKISTRVDEMQKWVAILERRIDELDKQPTESLAAWDLLDDRISSLEGITITEDE